MIKSFTIITYLGDSITLGLGEPDTSGFLITNVDGLGPVKADINMTDLATQDGSKYSSARAQNRNIVFSMFFVSDRYSIEEMRHLSYKFFPLKKPLTVIIHTDTRTLSTTGYVESNEPNIFTNLEGTTISVICPDAYLYEYNTTAKDTFYGISPQFEFPFKNDSLSEDLLIMGTYENAIAKDIIYEGDAEVGIIFHIYAKGSASGLTLYNLNTNGYLGLSTSILEGDEIIINTKRGQKGATLIRNGLFYNIINDVSRPAEWVQLTKGINRLAFTADEGQENLHVSAEYQIVYEGV